jgi:hypothetical protein
MVRVAFSIMDSMKFCPVCAKELVITQKTDDPEATMKECPDQHVTIMWTWNSDYGLALEIDTEAMLKKE